MSRSTCLMLVSPVTCTSIPAYTLAAARVRSVTRIRRGEVASHQVWVTERSHNPVSRCYSASTRGEGCDKCYCEHSRDPRWIAVQNSHCFFALRTHFTAQGLKTEEILANRT
jgi:hypothetical protein